MYPGPELHVVFQRGIAQPQHKRRMHNVFARVKRLPLSNIDQILLKAIHRELQRVRGQTAAHRERRFTSVGPLVRLGNRRSMRNDRCCAGFIR